MLSGSASRSRLLPDAVAAVNLDPDDGDKALAEMAEAGVRIG